MASLTKDRRSIRSYRLGCFLLVAVMVVVVSMPGSCEETPWQDTDNWSEASLIMQKFVKDRLKSPSTAEFPGMFSGIRDTVTTLPDHKYRVRSWVDSQNIFGAQIRMQYVGVVQQTSDLSWRLESLEITE